MYKNVFIVCLILTAVIGCVFWISYREHNIPRGTSSPIVVQQSVRPNPIEAAPHGNAELSDQDDVLLSKQDIKRLMSDVYKVYEAFGEEVVEPTSVSSDVQKLQSLLDTPEYATFLKTGQTSLAAFYDFFASHGVPLDKNKLFEEARNTFQKHFPGESAEALEPRMREALSNLYAESDGDQFVVLDFVLDERYDAWGTHYFQTDSEAFIKWGLDIIRNYDRPSTEVPVVETERSVSLTQDEPSDESLSHDLPPAASETPQHGDVLSENNIDIDTAVEAESLTRVEPSAPSNLSFENILRGAFPPHRVKVALQTLNRYEPKIALRQLRQSDPEVATYIERFIPEIKRSTK